MAITTTLCNKTLDINKVELKNKKCIITCNLDYNLYGVVPVIITSSQLQYLNGTFDFLVKSAPAQNTVLETVGTFDKIYNNSILNPVAFTANINNLSYKVSNTVGLNIPVSIGETSVFDGASIQISNKMGDVINEDAENVISDKSFNTYDFFAVFEPTLKVKNATTNTNIIVCIG